MARLGPFGAGRRVVVGVSGGADSMALAWLLRGWGAPLAIIVDHGLRQGSAAEASLTHARLAAFGVPARVVRVSLARGPDLGARARKARYAALFAACRDEGLPDLLVGHHAGDQAETVVLRARQGSGPAGLAGMAAIAWHGDARVLRPLLTIAPERLRATLEQARIAWVEDPTNRDPATARGALRAGRVPRPDPNAGRRRAMAETALADELARAVAIMPGGHAEVHGPLSEAAWSALVWTVSGREHPPGSAAVYRLARAGQGTLHGVMARHGAVARESTGAAVAAAPGAVWDGRFVVLHGDARLQLGALGTDAAVTRTRPGPPAFALQTLPAVRLDGKLLAVPHLAYPDAATCRSVDVVFRPMKPLAGAPFAAD